MDVLGIDFLTRSSARDEVPLQAKASNVRASTLVQSRRTVRKTPSNGNTFSPNQLVEIRVSDTQGYIVPSTMALHMKVRQTTPNQPNSDNADPCIFAFDDQASFINRVKT